jgi:hypothetical protein
MGVNSTKSVSGPILRHIPYVMKILRHIPYVMNILISLEY